MIIYLIQVIKMKCTDFQFVEKEYNWDQNWDTFNTSRIEIHNKFVDLMF